MASMSDLPIELLPFIFKHLGLVDLVRCRLVCKRWRFFCDEQKVTELTIKCDNRNSGVSAAKWFNTEKAIQKDCTIKLNLFDTQYSVFKKHVIRLDLLRNLKRLKVFSSSTVCYSFRLTSHLYRFEQLEQIDLEFNLEEGSDLTISHPNLRIVSIYGFFGDDKYLDLDTEKLEVLKYSGFFDSVDITHPSSIKHLTASLDRQFEQVNLTSFTNLEYLHGCCNTSLDPIILTQSPKLKQLKFDTDDDGYQLVQDFDDYLNVKQSIINLIQMRDALQRKELELYFNDFLLTDIKQFKRILRDEFARYDELDSAESMDEDAVDEENSDEEIRNEEVSNGENSNDEENDESDEHSDSESMEVSENNSDNDNDSTDYSETGEDNSQRTD